VVGVIDSGIDYNHEDLSANIWTNPGEIPDNDIDDDGNGYIDDVRGWNFVKDTNDPMDDNGHGTHCAGTIGAMGNNGKGVVGVNWNVKLMPLKFLNAGGSGSTDNAVDAVLYAASFEDSSNNKLIRITSNSWGGGRRSKTLENAIKDSGALFIAAAGNSGSSNKMLPAGYSLDNIISVAATDHTDGLWPSSNYGSDWVDLGAPGVNILSTTPGDSYGIKSGTSMATPHVAGVAALVMAENPTWTNAQVKSQILNTVDPLSSLSGKTLTGGRLNARVAVGASELPADTTNPSVVDDLAVDTTVTQTSLTLTWTAPGEDGTSGTAYLYDLRYSDATITESNWDSASLASGEPIPQSYLSSETFTITGLSSGTTYYFALKAADEVGNYGGLSNIASGTTEASGWSVEIVESGVGFYNAMVFDSSDNPAIGYSAGDAVKLAHWNSVTESWDTEIVQSGSDLAPGIDLAYDSNGKPALSYGWGKLWFAHYDGTTWNTEVLEKRQANNDVTCLVYDSSGNPNIAYRTTGRNSAALKLATWNGNSWDLQIVDAGAGARYNSLAFDASGNPAIAYSDDVDLDNMLDTLKYAHWNGESWDITTVETGVMGYGVFATLAFDPITGYPAIAHKGNDVRYLYFDGIDWNVEIVDSIKFSAGMSLVFDSSGNAYLSYIDFVTTPNKVKFATRTGTDNWDIEEVSTGVNTWRTSLKLDSSDNPAMSYKGPLGLMFAKKIK
jgi:hypothetical protein